MTQTWPETPLFVRLGSCVYTRAWISVPLCLCVEIHIKDIMRDRSCITQLGQSSRGAAGSSSRQMENVLAPLHAWTHSTPSSASTARNLANLRHNFKGTWFREPVNPAGPGRTAQIEPFCLKTVCFPEPGYTPPTVPAANEVERRSSVSQFVLHIFHLLKFPRFYSSPNVLIQRACVPAYIFLFVICKAVEHHGHIFPLECCRFTAAQGKLSNSDWTSKFGRAIRAILWWFDEGSGSLSWCALLRVLCFIVQQGWGAIYMRWLPSSRASNGYGQILESHER